MVDCITLDYISLWQGSFNKQIDGSFSAVSSGFHQFSKQCVKGKTAVFTTDCTGYYDVKRPLLEAGFGLGVSPDYYKTLYISPECKISRDTIRNSGFNITYSKDKADAVVIPNLNWTYEKLSTNMVCYDTLNHILYMVSVAGTYLGEKLIEDGSIDALKKEVLSEVQYPEAHHDFYFRDDCNAFSVSFIPRCTEYKEIYFRKIYSNVSRKYVLDNNLKLNPGSDITVDNLEIWSRCSDHNVLSKLLLNSPYLEYPLTLRTFISAECPGLEYYGGGAFKTLLSAIHYNEDDTSKYTVTAKDWNLLQKYIMRKLGVEEHGYIVEAQYDKLEWEYKRFIAHRVSVKEKLLDHDGTELDFINIIKSISRV